ncbi:MAG: hypothetical protein ACO1PN_15850 [Betaproteobacteria bacterium]
MTDTVLGLRFSVENGQEIVQAAQKGRAALDDLKASAVKANEEMKRSAQSGRDSFKGMGDAAKKSAEDQVRASDAYVATLRRQADTLGMSRVQMLAYDAAQKGLNQTQGDAVAKSILVINAHEQHSAALGRVGKATVATGAGIGLAAVALGSFTMKSINATAALDDLHVITGLSVESLSSLQQIARIGGHSFELVTGTASRFSQSVADAAGGNVKLLRSFDALGISQQRLRSENINDLYVEFATKIAHAENKTYAIAYATDLAGDSARQALPFFKDLAESGMAQAVVSARQADDANRLQKEIGKLKNEFSNLGTALGNDAVPWLKEMIEQMNEGIRIAGGFGAAVKTFGFMAPTDNPGQAAAGYKSEIAGLQAARGRYQASNSDTSGIDQAISNLEQKRQFSLYLQRQQAMQLGRGVGRDEVARFGGGGGVVLPPPPSAPRGGGNSGGDRDQGIALITQLENELAILNGTGSEFDALVRKLTDGSKQYSAEVISTALALKGEAVELKQGKAAREAYMRGMEADLQLREEVQQVMVKRSQAAADANLSMSKSIERIELETRLMGLSNEEREKTIALLELEEKKVNLTATEYERYREGITAAYDSKARTAATKKANDELAAEAKRSHEQISSSLTDALLRGFENGKDFAENFKSTLRNMFSTLILRPIIQPIAQGMAGAVTGLLGMGMSSSAGAAGMSGVGGLGSLGGTGGLMDWVMNSGGISGMAGMLTGGFDSIFQSAGVGMGSQFIADIGNYGLGMPMIGGALQMLTGNFKGGAGTMIGGAIGSMFGPLGTMAGSAIGGLIGNSIGGKKGGPASFTGLDVSGTANMQGLTSSNWLGNASNSNQAFSWASHDHGATGGMNAMIQGAFADMGKLAKALSLDASRLDNAQLGFSFRSTGMGNGAGPSTQEVLDAFGQSLGQLTDQMAEQLMPNIREFAQANETLTQTLVRLAEAQRAADLNKIFGSMQGALQLADQTRDLWLSDLSPLTAKQRLDEAQGRYGETLAKAQGGDLGAMGQLSGMARTYLGEARGYYASSADYTGIFGDVQAQIGNLVEDTLVEQSIAFSEMGIPLKSIDESIKNLDKRIVEGLESAIAARGAADDAAMRTQTESLIRATQDLGSTIRGLMSVLERA